MPDAQRVQSGTPGRGTTLGSSSTATDTVLQQKTGSVQSNALPATTKAGKGSQLPRKGSCIVDWGLNTVDTMSSKQTGDMLLAQSVACGWVLEMHLFVCKA